MLMSTQINEYINVGFHWSRSAFSVDYQVFKIITRLGHSQMTIRIDEGSWDVWSYDGPIFVQILI